MVQGILILALVGVIHACASSPGSGSRVSSARRVPVDTVGCLDTLHAADSVNAIVKIVVKSIDSTARLPAEFESLFGAEFRSRFKAPSVMPLSVVMGTPPCDSLGSRCVGGVLDLGAFAYATVHGNGTLSDISVLDVALTPSLADSVKSVLEAMSREAMLPPIGKADSIQLEVQLRSEQMPDSIPDARRMFRIRVPRYDLPFMYASMPASGVYAKYPMKARLAGVGDSVTVAMTVDSDGAISPESIELVRANYREFVASVAEALLNTRYHPARLGDCAVATRMEQRFLFKVPQ